MATIRFYTVKMPDKNVYLACASSRKKASEKYSIPAWRIYDGATLNEPHISEYEKRFHGTR